MVLTLFRALSRIIFSMIFVTALFLTFSAATQSTPAIAPKDLIAAGRVDEAIQTLQRQIDHSSTDADSYNLLCRAYFSLEQWDRAISACERAINLDPQNSLYHLWLGRAYGEKADKAGFLSAAGLAKKVRTEFERAVELNPADADARVDLAEFYIEAPGMVGGGKDKARAQADALTPLDPAMSHWVAGRIAEKNKDNDTAEREYRAAIAISHEGAHAWLNLAIFFRHTNRLDEMERAIHTMESRPMDRPESLMDGASLLFRTNRNPVFAISLLRRYLTAPVEEAPAFKAHDLLGQLLERQGDRQSAAEEFRAALALAHTFARAQENLHRLER
jgi:tetratricopeptide (TPR) repeat protein